MARERSHGAATRRRRIKHWRRALIRWLRTWRVPVALAASMTVGGAAFGTWQCIQQPPRSLAEAIEQRQNEFPVTYHVALPPSADERLGFAPEHIDGDERYLITKASPCFVVIPRRVRGLKEIKFAYRSSRELRAEMKAMADALGVEVADSDTATMVLRDLEVVSGVGSPLLNSPCDFHAGRPTRVEVVTSIIKAGSAMLSFERNLQAGASTKVEHARQEGSAGWQLTSRERGLIGGNGIVLAGAVSPVDVEVVDMASVDLGPTISQAMVEFPPGFDGRVAVLGYDDAGNGTLRMQVSTQFGLGAAHTSETPPEVRLCPIDEKLELPYGKTCYFISESRSLAVWWDRARVGGVPRVNLHMRGYKTTFARDDRAPNDQQRTTAMRP